MHHYICFDTRLGRLWIAEDGRSITHVGTGNPLPLPDAVERETQLLKRARGELLEFLDGRRKVFDLPIDPPGTEFQRVVWRALRQIPYGQTRTYAEVAKSIGRPKATRAVGLAHTKNPLLIVTPCHRVMSANGDTMQSELLQAIERISR